MSACPVCGHQSRDGAAYCGECGSKLPGDVGAPIVQRDDYITLPPGVTPVAATNTAPAPAAPAPAPGPPGPLPATPIVVPPNSAPQIVLNPPPTGAPDAGNTDVDATRAAAPRRSSTWSLVLPGGDVHDVAGSAVIGRAPDAGAHGAALAISVGAEQKSVSKSHAYLEISVTGMRVRDLGSVNGVVVAHADGRESEATESTYVDLADGDELELGEVVITVKKG